MLLDDLGFLLGATSVGVLNQTIFLGGFPTTPDTCINLEEYGGSAPLILHDSSYYENPRVQVTVRAMDYQVARQLAENAHAALISHNTLLNNTRYLSIAPLQSPFAMGRDGNNRRLIGFNVEAMKVRSV